MTKLSIQKAGMIASVQAKARIGWMKQGVSPGGPMDEQAFAVACALVGNTQEDAGLEFAQFGGEYRVDAPVVFAVTGGDVEIRIDGRRVRPWESHRLAPGAVLSIGWMRGAVWGYIAFSGAIDVPVVLGSRSTHLRAGLGGFEGRTLKTGDVLELLPADLPPCLRLGHAIQRNQGPVRVVAGPQDDYFDKKAWNAFLHEPFSVSTNRDRMASQLDGPLIRAFRGHDIVSDATPAGSIQVPGSGKPYLLTAERQTTGGYPKIATVASVDLARVAQMPSRQPFRFTAIAQGMAEALLIEARQQHRDVLENLVPNTSI